MPGKYSVLLSVGCSGIIQPDKHGDGGVDANEHKGFELYFPGSGYEKDHGILCVQAGFPGGSIFRVQRTPCLPLQRRLRDHFAPSKY
jgi:hypothetical protein